MLAGVNKMAVIQAFVAAAAVAPSLCAQPCTPFWVKPDPFTSWVFGGGVAFHQPGESECLYAGARRGGGPQMEQGIARWDGYSWQFMMQGLPATVESLRIVPLNSGQGPRLYLIGRYLVPPDYHYAAWVLSGQTWQPAPAGFYVNTATDIATPMCSLSDGTGSAIYGWIANTSLNGVFVAKWTGQAWEPVGAAFQNVLFINMRTLDRGDGPALYVYGQFSGLGGVPARNIARYKDGQWQTLGSGIAPSALTQQSVEVYDDGNGPELYIGGIQEAGGMPVGNMARWNGKRWASVPGAPQGEIWSLKTFDDGGGSALYAAGTFHFPGGDSITRFDGKHWRPLGAGSGVDTRSMEVMQDRRGLSLFISCSGVSTGGAVTTPGISQWVGCPNCYANCDNSELAPRLNVNDFICFLNRYAAQDPYSNCTVDATIDLADFICFMNKYAAGCP